MGIFFYGIFLLYLIKIHYMEREIMGYIKFTEKKAVTKPLEGKEGFIETWSTNENAGDQTFFNYNGRKFRLISRVEKKS